MSITSLQKPPIRKAYVFLYSGLAIMVRPIFLFSHKDDVTKKSPKLINNMYKIIQIISYKSNAR